MKILVEWLGGEEVEVSFYPVDAISALQELARRNPQHTDVDAYTLALAEWGLGIILQRPKPADFGLSES